MSDFRGEWFPSNSFLLLELELNFIGSGQYILKLLYDLLEFIALQFRVISLRTQEVEPRLFLIFGGVFLVYPLVNPFLPFCLAVLSTIIILIMKTSCYSHLSGPL